MDIDALENRLIICKLALERCQQYLTHMHALMYMCTPQNADLDNETVESMQDLLSRMQEELSASTQHLDIGDLGQMTEVV
jgi:hypothetical protein